MSRLKRDAGGHHQFFQGFELRTERGVGLHASGATDGGGRFAEKGPPGTNRHFTLPLPDVDFTGAAVTGGPVPSHSSRQSPDLPLRISIIIPKTGPGVAREF